jgi:tRNA A37 threonylcarbamoyltransferase TsaD
VSLLSSKQRVLEPKLFSHEEFGGIHPSVAIEAHQRNMVDPFYSFKLLRLT